MNEQKPVQVGCTDDPRVGRKRSHEWNHMSKKSDIIKGLRELAKTAIAEIQDIPESLFDAVKDYECEGESSDGTIKLKLVVTLPDDEPNARLDRPDGAKETP